NNAFADALSRVGHTYVTKEWPAEKVKAEKELSRNSLKERHNASALEKSIKTTSNGWKKDTK
ncbi:hypothetical protein ADUPG1_004131, partial [Aduncisulcus paluster]